LSKIGTSQLTLTNSTNTYSGATTVFAGTLAVGNNGLGSAAGATSVAIGATLQLTASYANAEPLTLNSSGSPGGGGGALVANMPGGGGSFAGAITNSLNAVIASIGGDFTIRGNINTGGSPVTITGSGNTIVAALITGNGSLFKSGSATLTLTSANTYTGSTVVSAGRLLIQNNLTASSSVSVTAGTIELATGGGHNRVIHTGSLSVTGTGRVDLQDNKLIVTGAGATGTWNGSAYTGVTGMVKSGKGSSNTWNGASGIITTQSQAIGSNLTTIGVARASDVRPNTATETTSWAGQTITGTDTLVMYTYGGDATLDGKINIDDYVRIDSGLAGGLTGWSNGDFNYDGKVTIDDYITVIDANIGNQNGFAFPTGSGIGEEMKIAAVPEPTCVLPFAAVALLSRRRRRWPA
jgi:autotransporter-associated beta strand protein